MLKSLAAFALAAALFTTRALAAADTVLDVEGTAPDGTNYKGSVTLSETRSPGKLDGSVYKVTWKIGSTAIRGIGIAGSKAGALSIGFISDGHTGVAIVIDNDRNATATIWIEGQPGTATETWTKPR